MPTSELGIDIPRGDPGQIESTASSLVSASGAMQRVASILRGNGTLAGWQGQAEQSYTGAASLQASAAAYAASQMAVGAGALQRAAAELTAVQQEVQQDLRAAQDAQRRIDQANRQISDAEGRITNAGVRLVAADAAAAAAAILPTHPGAGAAQTARAQAQSDLQQAQGDLKRAQTQLQHAQDDLKRAQLHAREANDRWHGEAIAAAAALAAATQPPNPLMLSPFGTPTPYLGEPGLPAGVPPVFIGAPLAGKPNREPGGGSGGNPWLIAPLVGAGYGTSAVSGAKSGVSGIASLAGRTLRTGAPAERSAAAPILRSAGGLAKDLEPLSRAAPWVGAGVGMAANLASGRSVADSALHTGLSAAGGVAGATVVGGACEGGTFGLGTPVCVVAGAGAAAVGGWVGDQVASGIDDVVSLFS